jgi:hypothetical protein
MKFCCELSTFGEVRRREKEKNKRRRKDERERVKGG